MLRTWWDISMIMQKRNRGWRNQSYGISTKANHIAVRMNEWTENRRTKKSRDIVHSFSNIYVHTLYHIINLYIYVSCSNRVAIEPRTHSVPTTACVHARACAPIRGRRQTQTQQRVRVSSYSFHSMSGSRSGCQRCSAAAGCMHTCTRSPHRGSPMSLTDVRSVSAYFTLAVPVGGSRP